MQVHNSLYEQSDLICTLVLISQFILVSNKYISQSICATDHYFNMNNKYILVNTKVNLSIKSSASKGINRCVLAINTSVLTVASVSCLSRLWYLCIVLTIAYKYVSQSLLVSTEVNLSPTSLFAKNAHQ